MEFQKVEDYSLFPWPERLWFVVLFLVIAVVVARLRPGWLPALWLGSWLLAVIGGVLCQAPGWVRYEPVLPVVEIVLPVVEMALASGIPTGLAVLWLAGTRQHRLLGMAAVQALGAVLAFLCGCVAAAVILQAIWTVA
jgi:hypothetical protein